MQPSLSHGLQAEGIKPMFYCQGKTELECKQQKETERVFVFLKLQNRLNPARHRRHADTRRHSGPPPCLSLPQRGFDQTEPFMGNDWRMHPLLSLQIYLTERAGKRGGEEGGGVLGDRAEEGGREARRQSGRERERERGNVQRCLSSRPSLLTRGAPAESCT